ncbi:MAG: ACT domain-containing protein [Rhodobacteraceae bacterium]|jgi:hypothetical protein|nr:ACT domain-containing protein [Paracoccaceae bacterium]
MTGPVRDGRAMVAAMAPALQPGRHVFVTLPAGTAAAALAPRALASFREAEGLSLVLPETTAAEAGLSGLPMAWITLGVNSALDGVGLTAAVAGALAARGIACNIVAAFHHDHLFVPAASAAEALDCLQALSASA